MSENLEDIGVLVARPEDQARTLCESISADGGRAYSLPAIEIAGRAASSGAAESLRELEPDDVVVFVSRNAVIHGAALFLENLPQRRPRTAAIGASTAQAMTSAGITPDIVPAAGFDSEALLAEDELKDVTGKRIVIVRGVGGRALLGDTLRERGAQVQYTEVYERRPAKPPAEKLEEIQRLLDQGRIQAVVALSVETLDNLHALLDAPGRRHLLSTPLVTVSARVVNRATDLGMTAARIVADRPDDAGIFTALRAHGAELRAGATRRTQ